MTQIGAFGYSFYYKMGRVLNICTCRFEKVDHVCNVKYLSVWRVHNWGGRRGWATGDLLVCPEIEVVHSYLLQHG